MSKKVDYIATVVGFTVGFGGGWLIYHFVFHL